MSGPSAAGQWLLLSGPLFESDSSGSFSQHLTEISQAVISTPLFLFQTQLWDQLLFLFAFRGFEDCYQPLFSRRRGGVPGSVQHRATMFK